MSDQMIVHGAQGTGSVIVEAALTLLGLPYRLADPELDADYEAALDAALKVNPMRQLPALQLPSGEILTESGAILIWLTEMHPGLAPPPGAPGRAAFLRWMMFVNTQIYAHFWARDDASRLVRGKAAQGQVRKALADRITRGFEVMGQALPEGRYTLGDDLTALDLYVAVVSRWVPGRKRLGEAAPRLREVARRVDQDPRLVEFWPRRFPFPKGWEG